MDPAAENIIGEFGSLTPLEPDHQGRICVSALCWKMPEKLHTSQAHNTGEFVEEELPQKAHTLTMLFPTFSSDSKNPA
jgi:hypothetical protein